MKKYYYLIPFLLLIFSTLDFAQSPAAFNYQAVIRDGSGNTIAESQISLRASIVEESINGNIAYIERHDPTTNTFGLINLQIGNGTAVSGNFATIDWGGSAHFLKIEIDPNGGNNFITLGTTQLLSVPYALQASSASFAEEAGNAESAGFAETAREADFAQNAVNAQQALFAQDAFNAQTAGFANEAEFARTAGNQFWLGEKDFIYYNDLDVKIIHPSINPTATSTAQLFISGRDEVGGSYPFVIAGDTQGQTFGNNTLGRLLRLTRAATGNTFAGQTFDFGIDDEFNLFIQPTKRTGVFYEPAFSINMQQGYVGINTPSPKAQLHITDGDVYIDDSERGVIMKDNLGNCWRVTVDAVGRLETTSLESCPGN